MAIQRTDRPSVSKAVLIGAVIEAIVIAPAAFGPWGHAGPESTLGWLSLFANLPGALLINLVGSAELPFWAMAAGTYAIQTFVISSLVFVWMRRRTARASGKATSVEARG